MDRNFYIQVLESVRNEGFLASLPSVFESKDYELIGESIINKILEDLPELDYVQFKKIVCMSEYYTREQYQNFLEVKNKYNDFLDQLDTKIDDMDAFVKVDEHSTQDCGSLIKRQTDQTEKAGGICGMLPHRTCTV